MTKQDLEGIFGEGSVIATFETTSYDPNPHPKGFQHPGSWRFSIGEYAGKESVCVNLECGKVMDEDYKTFHIHDLGGLFPRYIRIGLYVIKLRKQAVNYYSKLFPEWEPYLRGRGPQPLLEFEKRRNVVDNSLSIS